VNINYNPGSVKLCNLHVRNIIFALVPSISGLKNTICRDSDFNLSLQLEVLMVY